MKLKRLKIIHFYKNLLEKGGMPRETFMLAHAMSKFADIKLYTIKPGGFSLRQEINMPIEVFNVPSWLYHRKGSIYLPRSIISSLKRDDPDVVILTSSFIGEHYPLSRILTHLKIPYVVSIGAAYNPLTFKGFKGLQKKMWHYAFEKFVISNAAAVRIYSEVQKAHLAAFGLSPNRWIVAMEGIDWDQVILHYHDSSVKKMNGATLEPPVFGYLGRIDYMGKGLDLLVRGFHLYKKAGGRGSLRIVGIPEKKGISRIRRLINVYNITDLQIEGPLFGNQKYQFLESISCLVLPSRHEGIPRVLREALAVGCPIMVSINTNMQSVVEKYDCGRVLSMDPIDIARNFLVWDSLPEKKRLEMSKNALMAAQSSSLDWNGIARSYVDQLQSIL